LRRLVVNVGDSIVSRDLSGDVRISLGTNETEAKGTAGKRFTSSVSDNYGSTNDGVSSGEGDLSIVEDNFGVNGSGDSGSLHGDVTNDDDTVGVMRPWDLSREGGSARTEPGKGVVTSDGAALGLDLGGGSTTRGDVDVMATVSLVVEETKVDLDLRTEGPLGGSNDGDVTLNGTRAVDVAGGGLLHEPPGLSHGPSRSRSQSDGTALGGTSGVGGVIKGHVGSED